MGRLAELRRTVAYAILIFIALHVPLIALAAALLGQSVWGFTLLAVAAVAIAAAFTWVKPGSQASRYAITLAALAMPTLLLGVLAGHPWQIDVHMYFFALLAMLAAFCDWRSIVAGALAIALHHLVMNQMMPVAVFPGGYDLERVLLHAAIVIAEAAALLWLTMRLSEALASSESAVVTAQEATRAAEQLRGEQLSEHRTAMAAKDRSDAVLADFQARMSAAITAISGMAEELDRAATSSRSLALTISGQAEDVNDGAREAAGSVNAVAAATDQLSASISEISQQIERSSKMSGLAVQEADAANQRIGGLQAAAEKIEHVVTLIQDIAEQTNLLALNATIEAARAGDAGKGFAVVASEVKSLAQQTAKATEEISSYIEGLRSETGGAVEVIRSVGERIRKLDEIAGSVASAAEQQGAAAGEISRSAQDASSSTDRVVSRIAKVHETSRESDGVTKNLSEAAGDLSGQSNQLRHDTDAFLAEFQAAK